MSAGVDTPLLRAALKSQYHAGLAMLRDAIERCPDEVWLSARHTNAFWQVAYHAMFFTHLYMMPDEASFRPWKGHQRRVQHPDGIPGAADPSSSLPLIPRPYSRAEALTYWEVCDGLVDATVDRLDLASPASGFSWYSMPKLEHQMMNIRHLQHHTAQLADRLRAEVHAGVAWVAGRP